MCCGSGRRGKGRRVRLRTEPRLGNSLWLEFYIGQTSWDEVSSNVGRMGRGGRGGGNGTEVRVGRDATSGSAHYAFS